MAGQLTLRLPSAISRRRLQSAQKALVMEVMKDTLPLKPGTLKFLATSPLGSCRQPQGPQFTRRSSSASAAQQILCRDMYTAMLDGLCAASQGSALGAA